MATLMTFLESLGLPDPRKIARQIGQESPDPVVLSVLAAAVEVEERLLAGRLHNAVSARVSADPAMLALADQMEAELVSTPRRGRRG